MDRRTEVILSVHRLREAWGNLSEFAVTSQELGFEEIAAKAFELELQVIELHRDVTKLAREDRQLASREQPANSRQQGVPF